MWGGGGGSQEDDIVGTQGCLSERGQGDKDGRGGPGFAAQAPGAFENRFQVLTGANTPSQLVE